ncbi:hypothetical protein XENOCAPTIV_019147 [Xenoophorus captivus]|uniref:Secreted protein n=1 Tax=Xenoophorus captivus TaxID=1517983 RepID=A0ABV0RJC9_9TELE
MTSSFALQRLMMSASACCCCFRRPVPMVIMFLVDPSKDACLPARAGPSCGRAETEETLPRAQRSIRWTFSILHIPASLDDKGQAYAVKRLNLL